jgi:hypothetical protein
VRILTHTSQIENSGGAANFSTNFVVMAIGLPGLRRVRRIGGPEYLLNPGEQMSEELPKNEETKPVVRDLLINEPEPVSPAEKAIASVREAVSKLPDTLNAVGREISRTIERTIAVKDDYVVAVKLSPEAQDRLDQLVRAEVFKSRAEAAAFLIDEGIKTQGMLFEKVRDKIAEIERLRAELRGSLKAEAEVEGDAA